MELDAYSSSMGSSTGMPERSGEAMQVVLKYLTSVAFLLLALMRAPMTGGMEPMAIPAFEVMDSNGVVTRTSDFTQSGKCLLLYIQPRCVPCESLLRLLKKEDVAPLSSPILIIVGGAAAKDLQPLIEKFPDLPPATWYADPEKAVVQALKLHGVPVAIGVREGRAEWSLDGVPFTSSSVRSIFRTWLSPG